MLRRAGASAPAAAAPSAEQVLSQVARIVDAPAFSASLKTKSFLRYIVEQALTGNGRRLKQYTIATEAFGRDHTFDPETDPIVRLEAGKLRRALEMYYLRSGNADPVVISVPKGSYVPIFELNAQTASARPALPSAGDLSAESRSRRTIDSQRLGISPFTFEHDDNDCRQFASGLGEQLTVELARYRDLSVIPLVVEQDRSAVAAGVTTNARFVLTGNIRKSERHIRATVRLHDIDASSLIWTESFDFQMPLKSSLEAQDRVATYIAGAIADYYGVISHKLSLQAVYGPAKPWNLQDSIHRHRYLARTLTERVYRLARTDLETGIEYTPDHPMVWAALAHTIFYGNVLGFDRDDDWEATVYRYVQRSFEIDHKCAFGHVVMALYQLYRRQFEDVFETTERILAHNPHAPSTKLSAGFFRALAGDWDGGTEILTGVLNTLLHPPGWAYRVTFLNYFRNGQFEEALREVNKYHAPEHFTPSLLRAAALSRLGRIEEARAAASEVLRISPNFRDISESYFRYLVPFEDILAPLTDALQPTGLFKS